MAVQVEPSNVREPDGDDQSRVDSTSQANVSESADNRSRMGLAVFGLLHCIVFAGWFFMTAKGFPYSSLRFWQNSVNPIVGLVVIALGLYGLFKKSETLSALLVSIPGFWFGLTINLFIFTPNIKIKLLASALIFTVFLNLAYRSFVKRKLPFVLAFVLGVLGASCAIQSQLAAASTTEPLATVSPNDDYFRQFDKSKLNTQSTRLVIDQATSLNVHGRRLKIKRPRYHLTVEPMLTFHSCSKDGFWTATTKRWDFSGPKLYFQGAQSIDTQQVAFFGNKTRGALTVQSVAKQSLKLRSQVRLEREIFSHLNRYTYLELISDKDLWIEFGCCPSKKYPIQPWDYPIGRPAVFACWDGDLFRVLKASSAEKGPFSELGAGTLKRGEPLVIRIKTEVETLAEITFENWTQHASTDLSPTAGWGMPQNAVEFRRDGKRYSIFVTLAATSVGRGWDSVGHKAGRYDNNMSIKYH